MAENENVTLDSGAELDKLLEKYQGNPAAVAVVSVIQELAKGGTSGDY